MIATTSSTECHHHFYTVFELRPLMVHKYLHTEGMYAAHRVQMDAVARTQRQTSVVSAFKCAPHSACTLCIPIGHIDYDNFVFLKNVKKKIIIYLLMSVVLQSSQILKYEFQMLQS